jgi:hypothetical protein
MAARKKLDPREFGLHHSIVIEEVDEQTVALVMDRKSRIIMADGRKILDRVEKIRSLRPDTRVIVTTSAPVCSKTLALLAEHAILVLPMSP